MPIRPANRKTVGIAGLIAFHVGLTVAALVIGPWQDSKGYLIGLGDAQIALAMLLAVCSTLRWSQLILLVTLLLSSGCALHYMSCVAYAYPMVFGDEYLISLWQATALVLVLLGARRFWRARNLQQAEPLAAVHRAHSRGTIALGDFFVAIFLVGALLAIGRQAMVQTDVSGMYDPWETFSFGVFQMPGWFFARLPMLIAAVVWQGLLWTLISQQLLSPQHFGWRLTLQALALFLCCSLGEVAISSVYVVFDMNWPLLPVSMVPSCFLAQELHVIYWEGRTESSIDRELGQLARIFGTRLVAFGISLGLLRFAGFRLSSTLVFVDPSACAAKEAAN